MHHNTTKLSHLDPFADARAARLLDALDQQVTASAPTPDWKPIKTAPRDGTPVLVWARWRNAPAGSVVARSNSRRKQWDRHGTKRAIAEEILSHWTPLGPAALAPGPQ
jgi:hypothetical protein